MKRLVLAALSGLVLIGATLASTWEDSDEHFALKTAEPAVDATVAESPEVIKLWFTEEPQMAGARIRLVNAAGEPIQLGEVTQGEDDKTMIWAPVLGEVAPGANTVAWRAMAQDGHIVSEEFSFTFRAGQ